MDISRIDKNFSPEPADENGFMFRDVKLEPFRLEGLAWFHENQHAYFRLPKTFTDKEVNSGALSLAYHTAGVCVRFRSDSPEVMIRAKLVYGCDMNHIPRTGSCGFDSYRKEPGGDLLYNCTVQPSRIHIDSQSTILAKCGYNPDGQLCEWVVNFPLYSGVEKVEIGLKEGCTILPPLPHKVENPILFYGNSITQGGCASRPGNMYPSMLCRKVDAEQINLGFSGSGRGDIAVAKAIAELKLSAFVLDYDHNAPDPEHLEKTHEPFFRVIRDAAPDLPVIMMSMCDFRMMDFRKPAGQYPLRREIIRQTWLHAVEAGDRNVYFIDGETLFGREMHDSCTVDGCHPNDLGFYRMYKHVLPVLRKALRVEQERERGR